MSYDPLGEGQIVEIQRQVQQYLDGTIPEIEVGLQHTLTVWFCHQMMWILLLDFPQIENMRQIKEVFAQFKRLVQ